MDRIKNRVVSSFSAKARNYADRADIQSQIAQNLCEMLASKYYVGKDVKVLDVGCGTGFVAQNFTGLMDVMQLDSSPAMCAIASKYGDTVTAEMNSLPFKDNSFDMITASMSFQWSDDLVKTFSECYRVLDEGGVLSISIPGEGSLKKLRELFSSIGKKKSFNDFYSYEYIFDLLEFSKFKIIDFQKGDVGQQFDDVFSMLKSFKEIGANNSMKGGEVLTKKDLKFLEENYPKMNGKNILEWEIFYITAKK